MIHFIFLVYFVKFFKNLNFIFAYFKSLIIIFVLFIYKKIIMIFENILKILQEKNIDYKLVEHDESKCCADSKKFRDEL